MGGREHRAQQTAPREKKKAPQLESWFVHYTHAGQRAPIGTPPLSGVPSTRCNHTHSLTHKAHTRPHKRTHAHNLTSCRGATNVQPTYRPSTTTHKAILCLLDRLSLQDPRQQTTVGRAENFCLGRLHLHRARPRRPLSLNLTTHGLLLLPLRLLLLLLLSVCQPACLPVINLSVWQSVCLVCVCGVPSTYHTSQVSCSTSPLVYSRGQAERPHSRC